MTSRVVLCGEGLGLARLNWHLVPTDAEKNPGVLGPGWPDRATTDEGQIRRWCRDARVVGLGVLLGAKSGVLALDIDAKGATNGFETLAQLEAQHGPLPIGPAARTPSGGRHQFFAFRPDARNSVGHLPALELRCGSPRAMIVVVAPTVLKNGAYTWMGGLSPYDAPLPRFPDEWLEAFRSAKQEPERSRHTAERSNGTAPLPARGAYFESALRECEAVSRAVEGERNHTLNRAAVALGMLVGGGALDRGRVERDLLAAAEACGLPGPEAERTTRSGLEAGVREPRGVPSSPRRRARMYRPAPANASPWRPRP